MALKKSITTESLVHVEDAYHRVEGITHPSKDEMKFHVRSYVMKDGFDEEGNPAKIPHDVFFSERVVACAFQIDGPSAWHQAYNCLRYIPEFSDAVDC